MDITNLGTLTYTPPDSHTLLIAVRDLVLENPERHDQEHWVSNVFGTMRGKRFDVTALRAFAVKGLPEEPQDDSNPVCGTRACVAGWTVILGDDPRVRLDGDIGIIFPDGKAGSYSERARELLGINDRQAEYLFDMNRTRDEVIGALNTLIDDPDAEIWHDPASELTVTVTDYRGTVLYSTDVEVDDDDGDYGMVEAALDAAFHRH
jgi:hypothetical protein